MSRHDDPSENEVRQVGLRAHGWEGTLLDNVANASRQGSGFNPLCNAAFPGTSLFRDDAVGWNFEHIFNGALIRCCLTTSCCPAASPNVSLKSLHS